MMDHDGVELDKPYKLAVTVDIDGDEMHVDWTGTADTVSGPTNHPFVGTVALAQTALKSLTMPLDPMNHGHLRPLDRDGAGQYRGQSALSGGDRFIRICRRDGHPSDGKSAVQGDTGALPGLHLSDVWRRLLPHGSAAWQALYLSLIRLTAEVARFPMPMVPNALVFVGDGNAPNTPTEVIEGRYPLRVLRHSFNLGGGGRWQVSRRLRRDRANTRCWKTIS